MTVTLKISCLTLTLFSKHIFIGKLFYLCFSWNNRRIMKKIPLLDFNSFLINWADIYIEFLKRFWTFLTQCSQHITRIQNEFLRSHTICIVYNVPNWKTLITTLLRGYLMIWPHESVDYERNNSPELCQTYQLTHQIITHN